MPKMVSVRWKIAMLLFAFVVVLTALDAWLVPERAANAAKEALEQRARAGSAMLADTVRAALEFEQTDRAEESLGVALADPLIQSAAIYDARGQRLTAVARDERATAPNSLSASRSSGELLSSETPIHSGGALLGTVVVRLERASIEDQRRDARKAIVMQGIVVAAIGLAFSLWLASRMSRQIAQMAVVAEQISRGDVSANVALTSSNDELGEMAFAIERMNTRLRALQQGAARVAAGDLTGTIEGDGELYAAFRRMLENLRGLTRRVGSSSDAIGGAAAGMFSAVREQETLATQQTASLEEIRKTLEALAAAAETVARDAASVRETAGRALESSQRMAEQTRLVSAHSDRIGEILSLIQDIADRSDLLALNAALEGTRAGEVGRGFSLVAAEMRRLSEHVMDSVRDIRKLVADMRAASHSSVLATEESTKLARDAASAAVAISDAMRRHQEGTSQAKTAADEVVHAVNESLSGSASTTRSAEALLQLSHELRQATAAFRVASEGNGNERDGVPLSIPPDRVDSASRGLGAPRNTTPPRTHTGSSL